MEYMKKLKQPRMADLRTYEEARKTPLGQGITLNTATGTSLKDRSELMIDGISFRKS